MRADEDLNKRITRDGWVSTESLVDAPQLDAITATLAAPLADAAGRGGVRNLLAEHDLVRELASRGPMRAAAVAVLGEECGAVRAILFDKTPEANWKVIWHQDLTVAVQKPAATEGYGPWSEKAGVPHVQPPASILERMIAVRLHLDASASDNGPVRVIPGSHTSGKLSAQLITGWRDRVPEVECCVVRGGLLLFRPLLLHASSPAREPRHRRVLHIEYGPPSPGDGLEWHTWVGAAEELT